MLSSFFKFLCICATKSLPGIYKSPALSTIYSVVDLPLIKQYLSKTCLHLASACCLLLDANTQISRGRYCCASCKWPLASRSQLCLPCRDLALQEAPDATLKSACPAVTVPTKRHQMPLASQARPLLVSIVFIFDWCSYCTPQAGTATNSAVTVRHKLVLPPMLQLLYTTSWYCHQRSSYCTPQAGTITNVAVIVCYKLVLPPTVQLLYATSWYCHQQCSYCTPQAGTAIN